MMITSSWCVVYRAPTELCKALQGCLEEFYTHLFSCLSSKSLEAVDCLGDPGKFRPRSKFFESVDLVLSL